MQDDDILEQGMAMLDGNVLAGSKNQEKTIQDYAKNTDYKTALDAYYTAICAQLWLSSKDDPLMYGEDGAKRILSLKKIFNAGAVYGPTIKQHLKELGCAVPENSTERDKPHAQTQSGGGEHTSSDAAKAAQNPAPEDTQKPKTAHNPASENAQESPDTDKKDVHNVAASDTQASHAEGKAQEQTPPPSDATTQKAAS